MDRDAEIAAREAELVDVDRQIRALPGIALSEQGRSVNVEAARASLQARQDWLIARLLVLRPYTIVEVH